LARFNRIPAKTFIRLPSRMTRGRAAFTPCCLLRRSDWAAPALRTPAPQNMRALACLSCGSAWICASTSAGTAPSTSTRAIASPPSSTRPRWKVAMFSLASPSRLANLPMKPGFLIGDVDHRLAELGVDPDALDVDQPRLAVGIDRAGHRTLLVLRGQRDCDL